MIANVVAVYALQLVDFNAASAIGLVLVVAVLFLTVLYNRISHATSGSAH
jgi:ABC-type spermidine/putrescine transport system permease subunit I